MKKRRHAKIIELVSQNAIETQEELQDMLMEYGFEVEYKYKSTTKDTTSVTVIDKSTFSDWNRLNNIDRQRHLVFDALGAVSIDFTKYDTSDNIIKWNQIDIPIRQGEDVIVRVRYKFNVGQPFINVYSPWSDEITVVFPAEYEDNVELTSILKDNKDDTVGAVIPFINPPDIVPI